MKTISKEALKVALIFFIISFFWVIFSDKGLLLFYDDPEIITQVQSYKGWFYIIIVSIIIYGLVKRELRKNLIYEEKLVEEKSIRDILFDTANDAIIILDENNIFIDCNSKSLELLQCTKEQIIGKTQMDVSSKYQVKGKESLEFVNEKIQLARSGKAQTFEWIYTTFNGDKEFYTEVSLNMTLISGVVYLLAIVRDISRRKKVENELREKEEKYRRLTENSPDITYVYSLKKGVQYWSSRVKDILGFDPDKLINDTLKWDNAIHQEDRPQLKRFFENIQIGRSYELEYRIYDVHNELHWFYDRIFNVYKANGDIIVEGLISDITFKKKSEQILKESETKYRMLVENGPSAFWIGDKNGKIIYVSSNIQKIFGYSSQDVNKNSDDIWFSNIHEQDYEYVRSNLNAVFTENKRFDVTYRLKDKNGKWVWVHYIGEKYIDITGEELIYGIINNITDIKNAQQKILNTIIETEEKEKKRFAEDLHDELGPHLSAIRLYINELGDENLSSDRKKEIVNSLDNFTKEAIDKIRSISNQLMPNILTDFGLIAALKSFCARVNNTKKIRIELNIDELTKKIVKNIEIVIYRVVIELINNTIKHAKATEISIDLIINDKSIVLTYKDNGIGFDLVKALKKNKGLGLRNILNRIKTIESSYLFDSNQDDGIIFKFNFYLN